MNDSIFSSQFAEKIHVLANLDSSIETYSFSNDFVSTRCGRNIVWRLDFSNERTRYLKISHDINTFKRELFGHKLAEQIASHDNRFTYAPVIYSDRNLKAFITEQICGSPLTNIFRSAYRIDKCFFAKNSQDESFRTAFELLLEWLTLLRGCNLGDQSIHRDHSLFEIKQRIKNRLARTIKTKPLRDYIDFDVEKYLRVEMEESTSSLQFGDLTLGNFFFDGEKIGAIDFEDLGSGYRNRDFTQLEMELDRPISSLMYRSDENLQQLMGSLVPEWNPVVELELLLQYLELGILFPYKHRSNLKWVKKRLQRY